MTDTDMVMVPRSTVTAEQIMAVIASESIRYREAGDYEREHLAMIRLHGKIERELLKPALARAANEGMK